MKACFYFVGVLFFMTTSLYGFMRNPGKEGMNISKTTLFNNTNVQLCVTYKSPIEKSILIKPQEFCQIKDYHSLSIKKFDKEDSPALSLAEKAVKYIFVTEANGILVARSLIKYNSNL